MRTQQKPRATSKQAKFPFKALWLGMAGTVALIAYVEAGRSGADVLRWLALLPVTVGLLLTLRTAPRATSADPTAADVGTLLTSLCRAARKTAPPADRSAALDAVVRTLLDDLGFDRALILLRADDGERLTFGVLSHPPSAPDARLMVEQLEYTLDECADDAFFRAWCAGQTVQVQNEDVCAQTRLAWLCQTLRLRNFIGVPLVYGGKLTGVIVADGSLSGKPIGEERRLVLEAFATYVAVWLENVRLYQRTDDQLSARVRELEIISRISRELSYTLSVERVLELILDWALRFTGADAADVALLDPEAQQLHIVTGYGYPPEAWERVREQPWPLSKGIVGGGVPPGGGARVAAGRGERDDG